MKKQSTKTLRDEFAIAAMAAAIAGDQIIKPDEGREVSLEKTADWAYEMADVMLDARKGKLL